MRAQRVEFAGIRKRTGLARAPPAHGLSQYYRAAAAA